MKTNLPLLFAPLLLTAALAGQTAGSGSAPAAPNDFVTALRSALTADATLFEGRVVRKESEDAGAGGVMVVTGAPTAAPFHGRIDVLRRGGATLIVSKSELPAVAVFDDGTARITRTTVGADPVDAGTLARDLPDLLHAERLLRECATAEWRVEPANDGGRRATARLRRTLVEKGSQSGPMEFLSKKVERVVATVVLDGAGRLASLEFEVVRFDPNAAMRRRVVENGGGAVQSMTPEDLEVDESERADSDYQRDVYELRPAGDAIDARLERQWGELAAVARKDGF